MVEIIFSYQVSLSTFIDGRRLAEDLSTDSLGYSSSLVEQQEKQSWFILALGRGRGLFFAGAVTEIKETIGGYLF